VKSTALLFGENTKLCLVPFAVTMNTALIMSGYFSEQTWPYYVGVLMASSHLGWQISTVNLASSSDCLHKFKSNRLLGMLLFSAIVSSTLSKSSSKNDDETEQHDGTVEIVQPAQ